MNAICPKTFDGEVLRPGEGLITLITYPHPLRIERSVEPIEAGQTIADIKAKVLGDRPALAVLFGDAPEVAIPSELWHRVRPKPGTTLVLRSIVQGKNARILAMIGVAVAALIVPFVVPGLLTAAGLVGIGGTFAAGSMAGMLITGLATAAATLAITVGGMMLINTLIPQQKPAVQPQVDNGSLNFNRETVYSIAGASNQSRLFGTVPVVLGKHRIYPPYAAAPYTELIGNDQYLRLLFCIGYGPLDITEMKIGETPLANFEGVTVEVRNGYPTDTPVTLYPSDVNEQQLSIVLTGGVNFELVTAPDTDYISIDVTAPNGIYKVNTTNGAHESYPVGVQVYYWNLAGGPAQSMGTLNFSFVETTFRTGLAVSVPRGQYMVQVGKTILDANKSNIADQLVWTALRSTTFQAPIHFDAPLALVAMRIKATGQLNGVVSSFNCVAQSRQQSYNGTAFVPNQLSQNPADLMQYVLQHPANKRPVLNTAIDFEMLREFWLYCNERGYTYNTVLDSTQSVFATVSNIAGAGRGVPVFVDGRWSVAWDKFDSPIVQHFTPRNSSGFNGSRRYRRMPHGFRVKFINEEKQWAVDERLVFDNNFDESNATLYESIEFPGVTDPELIWKHARYRIGDARLRPEVYSLITDFEHLRCTRLDRVRVSHDVALIGQIAGRVKAIAGSVVTLDERVVMESGRDYGVRFRLANGDSLLREVIFAVGEHNSFTLSGAGSLPAIGDLAMFGEREQETAVFRVRSIEPQSDFRARLTLVDDAPDIDNYDTGDVPDFDSHITGPVDLAGLPPQDLHVAEIIDGAGAAKTVRARFSWRVLRAANIVAYEAQSRNNDAPAPEWGAPQTITAPQTFADFTDTLLGTWSFRVRSLFADGGFSDWALLEAKDITGVTLSSPLPDITGLRIVYRSRFINVDWQEVADFREPFYEIRKGDTWISAITVGTVAHPPFPTLGNDIYWIAAVATPISGLTVYSTNPQSITVDEAQLVENVVLTYDEAPSWPGTFSGSVAQSGSIIRTGGGGDILTEPDFLGIPDLFTLGGAAAGTYTTPSSEWDDMLRVVEAAISLTYKGGGVPVGADILSMADFLGHPDILESSASQLVEIYTEISVSLDGTTFGPWERWSSGVKSARIVKARITFNPLDPQVYAFASEFSINIDVPDRLDHYKYTTNVAGDTITFQPDLAASPAAFLGGPNGSAVPQIAYALINGDANDHVEVSSLTASSVFIRVYQGAGSGTGVSRQIAVLAQGY